jgi:surfactin synthase thioesterase subunit
MRTQNSRYMTNSGTAEFVNLFCLPFAGGSKYSYREFTEKAPPCIRILPLEYPGRGSRFREPLLTDINALASDVYQQLKMDLDHHPYAIFGHSMGGLLAWLLARKVIANGHRAPMHLFITGTMGPSVIEKEEEKTFLLGKSEFIGKLKSLDGIPEEILNNDELWDHFEPIMRADFRASESYAYELAEPLDIPMTVITGTEEDMEPDEIYEWRKETTQRVEFHQMQGKHFFIFKNADPIIEIFENKLQFN